MKITKRVVDEAEITGQDYVIWDEQLKGFGLRITQKGAKSYILKYRNENRQSRLFTIGRHGHLTPDQAREIAKQKFGEITKGTDPTEERQLKRKEYTVSELCDFYLEDGCRNKAETTIYTDIGRIEHHIKPLLGKKKISSVKRSDITKMMHDIADGKTSNDLKTKAHGRAIVRGGEGVASRTVSLLGAIYTYAIGKDLVTDNPCRGVKKFKSNSNERFLSAKEFQDLAEALLEAEKTEHLSVINIIRMLIFTGCRRSEIMTLKWEYVDFHYGCLRLPTSKTGATIIQLGPPALALLADLPREKDNPYCFPGTANGKHFVGVQKVWERIRVKKESLHDLRIHDLRHSFASMGLERGLSLPLIGKLLRHKSPATTARYAHLADDPAKLAADQVSNHIKATMSGNQAEIIELMRNKN